MQERTARTAFQTISNIFAACAQSPVIRGDAGYQTLFTSRVLDKLEPILFRSLHYPFQCCTDVFSPLTTITLLRNTETARMTRLLRIYPIPHEQRIPEVTFKSLSFAVGIYQSGHQLLSFSCEVLPDAQLMWLLPNQLRVYCWVYVLRARHNCIPCSMGYWRHAVAPPEVRRKALI